MGADSPDFGVTRTIFAKDMPDRQKISVVKTLYGVTKRRIPYILLGSMAAEKKVSSFLKKPLAVWGTNP